MLFPEDTKSAAESLRQFLHELERDNDLVTITEDVDPHLEVGAIIRKVYETEEKAPLFESFTGYDRGESGLFRILGAPVGLSSVPGQKLGRVARSLGLPPTASGRDIVLKINEAKGRAPLPSTKVSTGPVKEYKLLGDQIDLTALPAPLVHQDDGGKFLQSFGMHVVRTPDGQWVNWSITRNMVNDARSLVGPVIPRQDIGVIFQMWKDRGEDMPWALCFGVPPAAIMVGGMPIPKWTNETEFISAITGKPLEVVQCETNDLWVPANAEMVMEGVVSISETAPEGPMAEYHGLVFPGAAKQCPVFKVNAITHRKDPVVPISVTGRATEESHTVWGIMQAAEVLHICQRAGLPVKMVWNPFESHCLWFVVQVDRTQLKDRKTQMKPFCEELGHVIFGSKPGWYIPKLYVVGDDVDPTNLKEVIWAEATRCQPEANEFFFHEYGNIPLIPYVTHGVQPTTGYHRKVVRCCMFPCEFEDDIVHWNEGSFRGSFPADVQKKINQNWEAYGFGV
ncbi:hypothetical protein N8T08_002514 [Aspergillus melleus]|uniref:Uncharacterized protein n=1 Tax=Aspergillus melleus TaxID=138277 RepID=A0ACC3B8N4_9EURO|nr:hypothetical protein N8T08_002514 [Aspergillus melleus]